MYDDKTDKPRPMDGELFDKWLRLTRAAYETLLRVAVDAGRAGHTGIAFDAITSARDALDTLNRVQEIRRLMTDGPSSDD